jgi:hypothetical protein
MCIPSPARMRAVSVHSFVKSRNHHITSQHIHAINTLEKFYSGTKVSLYVQILETFEHIKETIFRKKAF